MVVDSVRRGATIATRTAEVPVQARARRATHTHAPRHCSEHRAQIQEGAVGNIDATAGPRSQIISISMCSRGSELRMQHAGGVFVIPGTSLMSLGGLATFGKSLFLVELILSVFLRVVSVGSGTDCHVYCS
jgi:hypothetical protein